MSFKLVREDTNQGKEKNTNTSGYQGTKCP